MYRVCNKYILYAHMNKNMGEIGCESCAMKLENIRVARQGLQTRNPRHLLL